MGSTLDRGWDGPFFCGFQNILFLDPQLQNTHFGNFKFPNIHYSKFYPRIYTILKPVLQIIHFLNTCLKIYTFSIWLLQNIHNFFRAHFLLRNIHFPALLRLLRIMCFKIYTLNFGPTIMLQYIHFFGRKLNILKCAFFSLFACFMLYTFCHTVYSRETPIRCLRFHFKIYTFSS